MNRLLALLAAGTAILFWSRRRALALQTSRDCPPDSEIYRFAVALGLVVVVVQSRAEIQAPATILAQYFTPLEGTYGISEQDFWNRFGYFVRDECQFYVYSYREQAFQPSARPLEDFRRWKNTGRI